MKTIHFIAIGGSAMHNLALALHQKGYQISGSDDAIFEPSKSRLEKRGILPKELGWFPDKITPKIDEIIVGMHAHEDNPELKKAKKLDLKIYSYPEYLYHQSIDKKRIVIGGSHGKTTITSMILHVLHFHKKQVDYMVGAQLDGFDVMVKLTHTNDTIVLEGDEYLSSTLDRRPKFLLYKPHIALISGIAWDHINVFPTFENYIHQFELFINSIEKNGVLVYNESDNEVVKLVEKAPNSLKKIAYNLPNYKITQGKTVLINNQKQYPLQIFGEHNLNNLEGARQICVQLGISENQFYEAIQNFSGASKRLELIIEKPDLKVFKDFAHAPSKVVSTTNAVKNQYIDKTVIACLELHTYSSLNKTFLKEYKNALEKADIKIVYYSEEALKIKRIEKIPAEFIKACFNSQELEVFTNPEDLRHRLSTISKENSIFLMMSSGNYGGINLAELFG
jgi:UDP-N-acetylmuramate: L-alanyl-gamma-D-glutamyl-meso-diaminopimelate ligase